MRKGGSICHQPIFPAHSKYVNDYCDTPYVFFTADGEPVWCLENVYFSEYGNSTKQKIAHFKDTSLTEYASQHTLLKSAKMWLHWHQLLSFLRINEPDCDHRYSWWTGKENWNE
ncbi:hypothetical protein KAT92_06850 [Candidatus Babeliales bacterium]|nr:hypothetical protein [Candidatus Babeliales bacterium]